LSLVAALALIVIALMGCGGSEPQAGAQPSSPSTPAVVAAETSTATTTPRSRPAPMDGLQVVYVDELPREAQRTIALIAHGGPFPFEKDGAVFQNRERLLPSKPQGYYREYTVVTPGEDDRGARRIVAGRGGELYYTADHYDSFVRVIEL
jgi:ribonuclease T1